MEPNNERRRFPRVKDRNVSVKLSGDGFNAITQSLDLSASGVYCKVMERIPVMTKVEVVLVIPGRNSSSSTTMNIDGIVVREQPIKEEGHVQHYDIAIFFNSLLPKEREKLINYINRKAVEKPVYPGE